MRSSAILLLLVALLGGCQPDDQETHTLDPREARAERSPELLAALDSGSNAYRARSYEAALEQYTHATELDPDEAAGWFGVYMAQRALGNIEASDEALDQARSLAPGATIIHPRVEDTLGTGGEGGTP